MHLQYDQRWDTYLATGKYFNNISYMKFILKCRFTPGYFELKVKIVCMIAYSKATALYRKIACFMKA